LSSCMWSVQAKESWFISTRCDCTGCIIMATIYGKTLSGVRKLSLSSGSHPVKCHSKYHHLTFCEPMDSKLTSHRMFPRYLAQFSCIQGTVSVYEKINISIHSPSTSPLATSFFETNRKDVTSGSFRIV
jgi:hypothetical protein